MPVSATPVLPDAAYGGATTAAPAAGAGRKWPWIVGGIVAALVITGIVLALVLGGGGGKVEVPNLQGMTEQQALSTLEGLGLKLGEVEDHYIEEEGEKAGVVISQDPEWGTILAEGEPVNITVSREMRMPEVEGMSRTEAENALKALGISVIEIQNVSVDDEDEINVVLSQDPSGGSLINPKTSVKLEVGVEQKKVAVPDVVGEALADAEEELRGAGFQVEVVEEASSEVDEGYITRQSPLANQKALEGSVVTIWVSSGPAAVEVPEVRGELEEDAKDILTAAGLSFQIIPQDTTDPTEVGRVVDQVPLPGAMVDAGYTVRIFIGRAP
jgi:serine/threonine-protein kinase